MVPVPGRIFSLHRRPKRVGHAATDAAASLPARERRLAVPVSGRPFYQGFLAGATLVLAPLLMLFLAGVVDAQGALTAADAPRLALVIGNTSYQQLPVVPTSVNDAGAVTEALENLGFEVTTQVEAPLHAMRGALDSFLEQLGAPENRNAVAVFYFSGHGLQYDGHNFVLPIDFDLDEGQDDLDDRALWLDGQISRGMAGARDSGANVILLEACREDPFGDDPGLAQIDIEKNLPARTVVVFAATPGRASADKVDLKAPELNGIFTKELVEQLQKAGPTSDLESFFEVVRNEVDRASNRAQQPRVMARLEGEPIVLARAVPGGGGAPEPEDLALWRSVEKSPDACSFDHYLASYPSGAFADLARAKIRAIQDKNEAMAKVLRDLPASVAAKLKAAQAESEARCAEKYGAKSAGPFPTSPARHVQESWMPAPRMRPVAASGERGTIHAWQSGPFLRLAIHVPEPETTPGGRVLRRVQTRPSQGAGDAPGGDASFRELLLKAEQGNVDAMYRVALIYEAGSHAVPRDIDEMVRWLSVSSALGNGLASYKLYRHYNASRRTLADAIRYKSLARTQGYTGPPGLSVRR